MIKMSQGDLRLAAKTTKPTVDVKYSSLPQPERAAPPAPFKVEASEASAPPKRAAPPAPECQS